MKSSIQINRKMLSNDGSVKYVLETKDQHMIECMYMPRYDGAVVICISSQIGCSLKCAHCATGTIKFERNLTSNEIYDEVLIILDDNSAFDKEIILFFMGMGEPLYNYENVIKAIHMFNQDMDIPYEKITVSTAGVVPGIRALAELNLNIRVAVSIHSIDDNKRSELMPINKIYNIKSLQHAIMYYRDFCQKPIILQYTLIKNFNDTIIDAQKLANFAKDTCCHVRIIPYNSTEKGKYASSSPENLKLFCNILKENAVSYKIRNNRGTDVQGGCGQLCLYMNKT